MKEQKRIEINFLENNHINTGAMLDTAIRVNGELFMIDESEIDFSDVTLTKSIRGALIAKQYPAIPESNNLGSITNTPKKPRTKTEFVKCEYGDKTSHIVLDFENNEPLYKLVNDEHWTIDELDDLFQLILSDCHIYRKVETEIDERQEFVSAAVELLTKNSHDNEAAYYEGWFESMFDSGKFKLVV